MSLVVAATRAMPANWLGLSIAKLLRKLTLQRCRYTGEGIDTDLWGLRLRLYPARNGCEKGALFTPQMYDVTERAAIKGAIGICAAHPFTFIDIGANAGLYSLYVAAETCDRARIIAIEPQPAMVERLIYNIKVNMLRSIAVIPAAVTASEGTVLLGLNPRDAGGAGVLGKRPGNPAITVAARPLAAILDDAGVDRIDALKIDIEGAEDEALAPFLASAPASLLPRLVIIEDSRNEWGADLFGMFDRLGYVETGRSKHNRILALAQI